MYKIFLLVLLCSFAYIDSAFHPNIRISSCPDMCLCENSFCRNRRGQITCSGVAVNCFEKSFTSVPRDIPLNVSGLLISNNRISVIDLDEFVNFSKLTNLVASNNNATEIRIAIPQRRIERLTLQGNLITILPRNNLTKIKNLVQLNLEDNRIYRIRNVRFPRKLDILNLNNNRLTSLPSGSFRKSKVLRVLKLNNNQIEHISVGSLKFLSQLESLELENNQIRELHRDVFSSLSNAWYLNIKNNRIREVHPHSFRLFGSRNENHHQIHLENNRLQFIEREILEILIPRQNRYSIYFAGNPIFCDCNLMNLRDEVSGLIGDSSRIFCDSPNPYQGTQVRHLQINDCCFK